MSETSETVPALSAVEFERCRGVFANMANGSSVQMKLLDLRRFFASYDAERARAMAAEQEKAALKIDLHMSRTSRDRLKKRANFNQQQKQIAETKLQKAEAERDAARADLELLQATVRWNFLPNFLETFDELRATGYVIPETEAEIAAALPFDIAHYPPLKPFVRPQDSQEWCKSAESEVVLVQLSDGSLATAKWTWRNYSNVNFQWEGSHNSRLMIRRVRAWRRETGAPPEVSDAQ